MAILKGAGKFRLADSYALQPDADDRRLADNERTLPIRLKVENPGGGLIADGHPVGATGVRQVFEAYQHLTGQAGARQIENAKRFLTFNMGGSLTTSVAMVWGRG